ncbi:esterase/lipase family protein [Actinocorallia populi]|uniref:esterase/lipase family protein n=1 Tax=Actinocorallia populi TaxID=2079200 RepID=UPI000D091297|nr:alpha/beta fold hydrolase [Actinocorallia populi]
MLRRIGVLLAATAVLAAVPAPARAARTPVVFVHGYDGGASDWTKAMSVFREGGYSDTELFAYEYDSHGDNRINAQGLAAFVADVLVRTGASQVDVVNHSMGGLVSLWYLGQLDGTAKVRRLASLAGANHGTKTAAACLIYVSCRQMYPESPFIKTITSGDETPGATGYATWYSPCDAVIVPYTSTALDGAANNEVRCRTHPGLLRATAVLTEIRSFLAA